MRGDRIQRIHSSGTWESYSEVTRLKHVIKINDGLNVNPKSESPKSERNPKSQYRKVPAIAATKSAFPSAKSRRIFAFEFRASDFFRISGIRISELKNEVYPSSRAVGEILAARRMSITRHGLGT